MIYNTPKKNVNACNQLVRYLCCIILLLAALPFITLAAIFSFLVDIPHIKIDLGDSNVVESVYFKLKRNTTEVEDSDEDEDEDEEFIELTNDLSKLLFNEDTKIITTESILLDKMHGYFDERTALGIDNNIAWDSELWRFLDMKDDETLTWEDLCKRLKKHYHVLGEDTSEISYEDSGNDADDEDDQPPITPVRRLTGRFAEDDEPPATPVRKVSDVECPGAPRRPSAVEVDSGVITSRLRATTNLNDSDSTQDHASSSETASDAVPPSETLPVS